MKKLLILFAFLPAYIYGQSVLADKYVDDRINSLTYLRFKTDGAFEYRYLYDLINDFATGHYRISKDTVFLTYDIGPAKPTFVEELSPHVERLRADTLIIKDKKLFQVSNNISQYNAKPIVINKHTHKGWKPPKSWQYRRRYFIFGEYQSTRSGQYYMIDDRYAYWKKRK
jgi:hypothetical protein